MSSRTLTPDRDDWAMSFRDWVAVLGGALGAFMAILDIQITNASLREVQSALGMSYAEGGWIVTSYLIAEIMVIPLTGFFGRVFGLRKYILFNTALFIVASMLCGLSWNQGSIIFFRALQGLGGGILIPISFQLMMLFMPPRMRSIGLAIFGLTATLAPTLGPGVGGWLTENYGWRMIFFFNLIPGIVLLIAMSWGLPRSRPQFEKLKRMDLIGAIALLVALASVTYILEDGAKLGWFEDGKVRACALAAILSFPIFLTLQFSRKPPLLNLALFNERNFVIAALTTLVTASALYGGVYCLSLYLSQVQGYGAIQIGSVMIWLGIPQLIVMPLMPVLMKKVNPKALAVAGLGLFAWSNLLNSGMTHDYGGEHFRISLIFRAIGQPLFMIPLSSIAMSMVPPAEIGNASAIYNVMRNLGGSIGIALSSTLMIGRQAFHLERHLERVTWANLRIQEGSYVAQRALVLSGATDRGHSEEGILRMGSLWAQRESLVESFNDIYFLMSLGLLLCAFFVLLLKTPTGDQASASFGGGH